MTTQPIEAENKEEEEKEEKKEKMHNYTITSTAEKLTKPTSATRRLMGPSRSLRRSALWCNPIGSATTKNP